MDGTERKNESESSLAYSLCLCIPCCLAINKHFDASRDVEHVPVTPVLHDMDSFVLFFPGPTVMIITLYVVLYVRLNRVKELRPAITDTDSFTFTPTIVIS